jgi:general secretion pathway protein E
VPAILYRAPNSGSRHIGYKGRTGIYEYVVVDEVLRRLIHESAAEAALDAHARTRTPAMLADGWRKCLAGVTSAEEVLRVTREE